MHHPTGDTQRNSSNVSQKFFKPCDNHPVLDSAALFIHKTDIASLSAIHSNVANFSNLKLSQTHHDLLNLGLSFCPTPRHINPVKVCYDNEQFRRRLRLQEYFSTKNRDNCSSTNNNKTKEWTPDGRNQFIDSFVNRARTYYDNFVSSISHDTRSNLPNNQQSALKDLSSNNDIVIKEADKGGAITIINKEGYITDCNTLLEDNSTYHKTTTDVMQTHLKEAENLFDNITVANKEVVSKLLPTQPKPGLFYTLPKLHKLKQLISSKYNHSHLINTLTNTEQITQVANSLDIRPPYRPIVSCKGTLTEHISGHVDSILQNFLDKIPSFLKDTTDFLCKLNDITHLVTPDSLLVTMDVNSLYTNIPHSDGVEACRSFLTMNTIDQALISDIPTLVDFILKHNLFVFDDEQYLQINDTAMGKKMAPTYANIFMYYIESTFLSSFNLKPTAYFRYIDDIFLIWPQSLDTLQTFLENANRTHQNISFTHEYSSTAVSFLDVIIKINNGIISTSLYKKNTDNHR